MFIPFYKAKEPQQNLRLQTPGVEFGSDAWADGFHARLQGDLGPFNPGLPVDVPLWLALNFKQRQKCRIIPPDWMDVGNISFFYFFFISLFFKMTDLKRNE